MFLQNLAAESLHLKASPAFEKYENAVPKLSKSSEITLCWVIVHISSESGSSVEFIHFKG